MLDSDYSVRLATLGAMGGDITKQYDSVYEIDLAILDIIEHGGGGEGARIDDSSISTITTWSSSKIVSELADAGFDVEIVEELPSTGAAHTLYFVPSSDPQTQNVYDEYLYANSNWEQVGSTAIDLSNYYTKSEANAAFNPYNTVEESSIGFKFPTWNARGQITGYRHQAYEANFSINDTQKVLYGTSMANWPSIYAPTTTGTAGQYLVSAGSGAPVWQTSSFAQIVELTQSEYDALSTASKNNGNVYSITNATIVDPADYYTKTQANAAFNPLNTVSANSGSYKFPNWNANGQINGTAAEAYQATQNINGTDRTIYSTSNSAMPTVYAPTTAGTSGQYLVSAGSGAPVWQALEVASDYVISDADASAGTYSSDISAFYTKTMSEGVVQGVQIKFTDAHVVDNETVYSDSYYLPSSSRIYTGSVELWLMTTEDGVTWENRHYLITHDSITLDVTTGTFGPVNA